MKYVFLFSFIVMALLSIVAALWKPGDTDDGRIEITWASDDNPVRRERRKSLQKIILPQYGEFVRQRDLACHCCDFRNHSRSF